MIKIRTTIIAMSMIFLSMLNVYASDTPTDIMVNKNYIKTEVPPIIDNGNVLAPLRAVVDALGGESTEWDSIEKTATIWHNSNKIKIKIGDKNAEVNGRVETLPIEARIYNDRTFVPVRFIANNFGAEVFWEEKTYTVNINKDNHLVDMSLVDTSYTENDLNWLAKIVHAEAQGESGEGKIGVANVILNRVDSAEFPNTIYDVIFDRQYGVQFTPVANGEINNNPTHESYSAAKKALKGENIADESLYFCNPRISTNSWIINNRPFHKRIGLHDFYL